MSHKMIALDEPTRRFLRALRYFRRRIGKHQREIAEALKLDESTYQKHELGLSYPSLENLMRLAEYFSYDLSESVNHKVYYGTLKPSDIKRALRHYDLSYRELSEQTGYSQDRICYSVCMTARGSLACLSAVLSVLRSEQESESIRRELCSEKRRRSKNAESTTKFLGDVESSDGASGTDNHVSSARLRSVARRSSAADLTGGARDDERRP